jgi:hypothetical protein
VRSRGADPLEPLRGGRATAAGIDHEIRVDTPRALVLAELRLPRLPEDPSARRAVDAELAPLHAGHVRDPAVGGAAAQAAGEHSFAQLHAAGVRGGLSEGPFERRAATAEQDELTVALDARTELEPGWNRDGEG